MKYQYMNGYRASGFSFALDSYIIKTLQFVKAPQLNMSQLITDLPLNSAEQ